MPRNSAFSTCFPASEVTPSDCTRLADSRPSDSARSTPGAGSGLPNGSPTSLSLRTSEILDMQAQRGCSGMAADLKSSGPLTSSLAVRPASKPRSPQPSTASAPETACGQKCSGWCEAVPLAGLLSSSPPGNKAWETQVESDLAGAGYGVKWLGLSAAGLGAPHLRRRRFALAHRDHERLEIAWQAGPREAERIKRGAADGNPWRAPVPRTLRVADGVPGGLDRKKRIMAIGDSNPPVMLTVIGRAILEAA